MCRLAYTVRAGGACLSAGARATAASHRVLELSRQRGGYTAVFLLGEWVGGRVYARRESPSHSHGEGSVANR